MKWTWNCFCNRPTILANNVHQVICSKLFYSCIDILYWHFGYLNGSVRHEQLVHPVLTSSCWCGLSAAHTCNMATCVFTRRLTGSKTFHHEMCGGTSASLSRVMVKMPKFSLEVAFHLAEQSVHLHILLLIELLSHPGQTRQHHVHEPVRPHLGTQAGVPGSRVHVNTFHSW